MTTTKWLLLAASVAIGAAGNAQNVSSPVPAASVPGPGTADKVVEGATAGRVEQVERCQGHKFESMVEIDPVRKRSTRVKLCANPGSSDADWVKTLEAAKIQIEQRDMPPAARDKLIAELNLELARYAPPSAAAPSATAGRTLFPKGQGGVASGLIEPAERFETSTLPPIPPRKVASAARGAIAAAAPVKAMGISLRCLEPRDSGTGAPCDFLERDTIVAVSAVQGLEAGGTLRFLRRGEPRGHVILAPMRAGQLARVRLPAKLCWGISSTKVEIELLPPGSAAAAAARLGPYRLHC